jgi:hypothetical protein
MRPRICKNKKHQYKSVSFLYKNLILSIYPVRIHGSLSCEHLSWDFLQKFACQSAKAKAAHSTRRLPCTLVEHAGRSIHLGQKQTVVVYFATDGILIISSEAGKSCGQPRCIPLTRLAALIVSLHTPSSSDLNYESMIQLSQGNRQSRNHGCEPSTRIQQKISRPAMARRPVAFAD